MDNNGQAQAAQAGHWMGQMCGMQNVFSGKGQPTDVDTPIVTDPSTQKNVCEAQIVESKGFDKVTAEDLLDAISVLIFYQPERNAKLGHANTAFGRLYCNLFGQVQGTNTPISDDLPENKDRIEWLVNALIAKAKEWGVEDQHLAIIRIKLVKYFPGSGIDWHPDARTKEDDQLYWLRSVISMGEKGVVRVEAKKVYTKHTYHPPKAFDVCTLETGLAHFYAMSSSGTGRNIVCYTNDDKTEAIQMWHRVDPLPIPANIRIAVIIDLPFTSKQKEMDAMDMMQDIFALSPFSVFNNSNKKQKSSK